MRIVINDANILIDLVHLELIDDFFQLNGLDLKTTDFVYEELREEQKSMLARFIEDKKLQLIESGAEELLAIATIQSKTTGLSIEDCSVWFYAQKNKGILLTGDGRLRKQSSASGVEVKGILFVFDQLLLQNIITFETALLKLNQLYTLNSRLPLTPKNERITAWSIQKHVD